MNVENRSVMSQEEKVRTWVRKILKEARAREELGILVEESRLLNEDEALYLSLIHISEPTRPY